MLSESVASVSGVVSSVSVAPQHTAIPQLVRVSVVERAPPVPDVWKVLPSSVQSGQGYVISVVIDRQGTVWLNTRVAGGFYKVPNRGYGIAVDQIPVFGMAFPHGLATDNQGNMWASETAALAVRRVANYGTGAASWLGNNGATSTAPRGITVDDQGYVYVCDQQNDRLIRWASYGGAGGTDGQLHERELACVHRAHSHVASCLCLCADPDLLITLSPSVVPYSVAVDSTDGSVYVTGSASGGSLTKILSRGSGTQTLFASGFGATYGLFIDPLGNLFVHDQVSVRIRRYYAPITAGLFTDIVSPDATSFSAGNIGVDMSICQDRFGLIIGAWSRVIYLSFYPDLSPGYEPQGGVGGGSDRWHLAVAPPGFVSEAEFWTVGGQGLRVHDLTAQQLFIQKGQTLAVYCDYQIDGGQIGVNPASSAGPNMPIGVDPTSAVSPHDFTYTRTNAINFAFTIVATSATVTRPAAPQIIGRSSYKALGLPVTGKFVVDEAPSVPCIVQSVSVFLTAGTAGTVQFRVVQITYKDGVAAYFQPLPLANFSWLTPDFRVPVTTGQQMTFDVAAYRLYLAPHLRLAIALNGADIKMDLSSSAFLSTVWSVSSLSADPLQPMARTPAGGANFAIVMYPIAEAAYSGGATWQPNHRSGSRSIGGGVAVLSGSTYLASVSPASASDTRGLVMRTSLSSSVTGLTFAFWMRVTHENLMQFGSSPAFFTMADAHNADKSVMHRLSGRFALFCSRADSLRLLLSCSLLFLLSAMVCLRTCCLMVTCRLQFS